MYILSIDQSTSATKAMLFDKDAQLICRSDIAHKQIITEKGWVEHNPDEIFNNLINAVKNLIEKSKVRASDIIGVGISNQRETALVWDKNTGNPIYNAIVWQCARGADICKRLASNGDYVLKTSGIPLSPYYSAAKIAWILENVKIDKNNICCSTMDSWLVFKLCGGTPKTDYSNASRTQLFNITSLKWDDKLCELFGISTEMLPHVCDSNSIFGYTDFSGLLEKKIPVHSVMGDSHAALFGQGCTGVASVKATYGTGSSVMMNIGDKPIFSNKGIVTSLAWSMDGTVNYVLEGNINYTGAILNWLKDDLGLINSYDECASLAQSVEHTDDLYLIPAFSGLSAPYWDTHAKAMICGMTRNTKRADIVRCANEAIAYQIADIINIMQEETGKKIPFLKVDGGPTHNEFLMQFQSDIINATIEVPAIEELSGFGVALCAGLALTLYDKNRQKQSFFKIYSPLLDLATLERYYKGWKDAVAKVLS